MTDIAFLAAVDLADRIRRREIGSEELLDHFLARIDRHDGKLNAVIWKDVERARAAARAADAMPRDEAAGRPFHGLPITVKESFDVAGAPTTWGDPAFRDNIASRDALAVERMQAAGAVPFGKTNVPLMLADWQTYNAVYGTTNNPWDVSRAPGGSSGGSAVALATGMTGLEYGSDIGASIRNPAHYCGLFGHKPSWGICSPFGHALPGAVMPSDISVIGPLARSARDLDPALDAILGPDPLDSAGWRVDLPPARAETLHGLRVAVMLDHPECPCDTEMTEVLQGLVDFLDRSGARVSDRAQPALDMARLHALYIQLLRAATSGRMNPELFERQRAEAAALPEDDESYYARTVRANTMHHKTWLGLSNERHRMRYAWADFFREWDVLLCPVGASAAQPHDQQGERWERSITVNGAPQPATQQLFWAGVSSLCYLPGTVAPAGLTRSGLPVGVQIVGPYLGDRTTIALARMLEREWRAFEPPPGYA